MWGNLDPQVIVENNRTIIRQLVEVHSEVRSGTESPCPETPTNTSVFSGSLWVYPKLHLADKQHQRLTTAGRKNTLLK